MKKIVLIFAVFIVVFATLNIQKTIVLANENEEIDKIVNELIDGINEQDYVNAVEELNLLFNNEKTLKERLIDFFTGEVKLDSNLIFSYFKNKFLSLTNELYYSIILIILLGIIYTITNIIIPKISDNSMKNTIFFICYSLSVLIIVKLLDYLFNYTYTNLNNVSNLITIIFPSMFSLIMLIGNFGIELFKPFTAFLCFFSSSVAKSFFFPLLSIISLVTIVSSFNEDIKFDNLKKTLLSFFKWSIGIITALFSILLTCQGFSNIQYNGISVKILKYASGTLIPIVGNFLSGGIDVLLASSVLIKNSLGIFSLLYILLISVSSALNLIIFSFAIKFISSLSEPLLDRRFINVFNSIGEIINGLASLILLSGFMFILTILFVILSTSLL